MCAPERQLVTSADADADLLSIALSGVDTWGREQALRYLREIAAVFDSLARFPDLGRRGDALGENVRFIRARDHVVYYEYDEQVVTILHVLHARMNPEGRLGNEE